MPQTKTIVQRKKKSTGRKAKVEIRYTVGLAANLATLVHEYAETADTSMSKAIATLVRFGLESLESRKQEFINKMKANLASNDPEKEDQLVDEFRALILGR